MHDSLHCLPQHLLHHLGAFSRLETLAELPPISASAAQSTLHQSSSGEPYHVSLNAQGLTLTLQCINPTGQPEEQLWGLHGITLDAASWGGGWPAGLNPHETNADDLVALFAPNPEEVMNLHPMLCFAIEGLGGQTCSVLAVFDSQSKKLSSFNLLRVGEWRELQAPRPPSLV